MAKVYVIFEGLCGGYLPNNVEYYRDKATMLRRMVDIARDLRDSGCLVSGNARTGGYLYRCPEQDWWPYSVTWEAFPFTSQADAEEFIRQNEEV